MEKKETWGAAVARIAGPGKVNGQYPRKYVYGIRRHLRCRSSAVEYLCNQRGERESRFYGGHKYLAIWRCKVYGDLTVDGLYARQHDAKEQLLSLCKDNDGERGILYTLFRAEHSRLGDDLFNEACEDAWSGVTENQYTFYGEDDYTLSRHGRSGGWFALEEAAGLKLYDDLYDTLMEKDGNGFWVKNDPIIRACLIKIQIEADWPEKAIEEEVAYRAAEIVWGSMDPLVLDKALYYYRNQMYVKDVQDARNTLVDVSPGAPGLLDRTMRMLGIPNLV